MNFDGAVARLLGIEGGYSNRRTDAGGATMWGISEAVARANGYGGAMRELPKQKALDIYRAQYWNLLALDTVSPLSGALAYELFEFGVNCGVAVAARALQRALNGLNRAQRDYPDIAADGVIGPRTLYSLRRYLATRGALGESVLLKAVNCLQGARYVELAEAREFDETNLFGWLAHRVELPEAPAGALL